MSTALTSHEPQNPAIGHRQTFRDAEIPRLKHLEPLVQLQDPCPGEEDAQSCAAQCRLGGSPPGAPRIPVYHVARPADVRIVSIMELGAHLLSMDTTHFSSS